MFGVVRTLIRFEGESYFLFREHFEATADLK